MNLKYKQGDLIKAFKSNEVDVLIHGCNCHNTMGAGIAKQIKWFFPEAYEVDAATVRGSRAKLGTITTATIDWLPNKPTIVNAYTQMTFWNRNDMLDYTAVEDCLKLIKQHYSDKRIGMPKIGCGLAHGDWCIIEQLIKTTLTDMNVTIYELT